MGSYDPTTGTKTCGDCGQRKAVADFNLRKNHGSDPYAGYCRECAKLRYKKWATENRDKKLAYMRDWYEKNIDSVKVYNAESYYNGGKKEKTKQIVAANRTRYNSYYHAHRARKAAGGGTYKAEDVDRIYKAQGGKCAACRVALRKKYHIDHIVALSRGGSNFPSNLQLLCPHCNLSKSNTDPIAFMRRRGRLL